jgi:hypothetical protein
VPKVSVLSLLTLPAFDGDFGPEDEDVELIVVDGIDGLGRLERLEGARRSGGRWGPTQFALAEPGGVEARVNGSTPSGLEKRDRPQIGSLWRNWPLSLISFA